MGYSKNKHIEKGELFIGVGQGGTVICAVH